MKTANILFRLSLSVFISLMLLTSSESRVARAETAVSVSSFGELETEIIAYGSAADDVTISVEASFDLTALLTIPANANGKTLTIRSNGGPYTLIRAAGLTGHLLTVSTGATLAIANIIIDGNKTVEPAASGSLVRINEDGNLVINEGAMLQNNSSSENGAGVSNINGKVTMNGGQISGNVLTNGSRIGAGIYNEGQDENSLGTRGLLVMYGGLINSNAAAPAFPDPTGSSHGGGVACQSFAKFEIYGGTISNNNAMRGGGVFLNTNSVFLMYDGATITENASINIGGGVCLYNTSNLFEMQGGLISKNTVEGTNSGMGGGVYVYKNANTPSSFQMSGGSITENQVKGASTSNMGGGVFIHGGQFTLAGGEISNNCAGVDESKAFSAIVFSTDYIAEPFVDVEPVGSEICNPAEIVLADSARSAGANYGGGVTNFGGSFTMSGGKVNNNFAEGFGGGVNNYNSAQFTQTGGVISKNSAAQGGGTANILSTLTLTKAEISGNSAVNGAGIFASANSPVQLSDAKITGNTAAADGGGLYLSSYLDASLLADDSASFSTNSAAKLVAPPTEAPIPAPQWEGSINSTSMNIPGDKTVQVFNNYDINITGEELAVYALSYNANGGGGNVPKGALRLYGESFSAAKNTLIAPTGMHFVAWNSAADGTGKKYLVDTEVLMPDEDFTLYAQWSLVDYSITYSNLYDTTNRNPSYYNYGNGFTLQRITRAGYHFDGWFDAETGGNRVREITDSDIGDLVLYAHWTVDTITPPTGDSSNWLVPTALGTTLFGLLLVVIQRRRKPIAY